ncbi:MAG: GtrA family protein [Candidatus Azobacteroides sp.]|nr:GtrA family protein [Candidatus Azobacteroides sp.]
MSNWIRKRWRQISAKRGIFTFIRAQLSSQLASFTDFSVSIILANVFNVFYVYATFIGSVCGGIVNCIVNYRWTFKALRIKKRYVAIKYFSVWICSIYLNTSGIYLMTELLRRTQLNVWLGHFFDNIFIVSKIIISLLVGYVWNYNMQRIFVYKNQDFRKYFKKKDQEGEIID